MFQTKCALSENNTKYRSSVEMVVIQAFVNRIISKLVSFCCFERE